jgi:hypothetical protein
MKKESIHESIDKQIKESLVEGHAISIVQSNLNIKIKNFISTLSKDSIDLEKMYELSYDDISPIRTRYGVTYIKHCKKRVEDLDWLSNNKFKFRHLSNSQVFNLIKLKEKLSFENSFSMPF